MKNLIMSTQKYKQFAAALSLAFAALTATGLAEAAQVTIGGKIDTGLTYTHADGGVAPKSDSLEMSSGNYLANRIIIRGYEDISDATRVGFYLESGFDSDTGAMKTDNTLFDRGSWLYVKNQTWGQLSMGRIGLLRTGATPLNYFTTGERINPFGTGWGGAAQPMYITPFAEQLRSNMVHWQSAKVNGFAMSAQYSMGNGEGEENKASSDRYAALSVTYDGEKTALVGMVDWMNEKSASADGTTPENSDPKDAFSVMLGGNVDFGFAKFYAWAQWFEDWNRIMMIPGNVSGYEPPLTGDEISGYTLTLASRIPAWGGFINLQASYMDADNNVAFKQGANMSDDKDMTRLGLFAGYEYHLSKRTVLYTAASFYKDDITIVSANGSKVAEDPTSLQIMAGLEFDF